MAKTKKDTYHLSFETRSHLVKLAYEIGRGEKDSLKCRNDLMQNAFEELLDRKLIQADSVSYEGRKMVLTSVTITQAGWRELPGF